MCLICERVSNLICFISEIILDDALKKMYQHLKFNSACFHNFLFPFPHTSNLTVVKNYWLYQMSEKKCLKDVVNEYSQNQIF